LIRYVRPLGVTAGTKTDDLRVRELPQYFTDRFGWDEMMREVAAVYRSAPGATRDSVGVMTGNYCEASAVHVHGARYWLPEALSDHGWFYFEGLRRDEWRPRYVAIGVPESRLRSLFRQVERETVFRHPLCMPHETDNAVYLCSNPRVDLRRYWRVAHGMDPAFERMLRQDGVDAAVALYYRSRKIDPGAILFSERQMNDLGYEYLQRSRIGDAIALFAMNVETYPESFNVYDSLGEALMAARRYPEAVANYRRSIELNPGNENGRQKLSELRKLMATRPGARSPKST
jgi:tetratricopeptide (TPR) repeat protein